MSGSQPGLPSGWRQPHTHTHTHTVANPQPCRRWWIHKPSWQVSSQKGSGLLSRCGWMTLHFRPVHGTRGFMLLKLSWQGWLNAALLIAALALSPPSRPRRRKQSAAVVRGPITSAAEKARWHMHRTASPHVSLAGALTRLVGAGAEARAEASGSAMLVAQLWEWLLWLWLAAKGGSQPTIRLTLPGAGTAAAASLQTRQCSSAATTCHGGTPSRHEVFDASEDVKRPIVSHFPSPPPPLPPC